MRSVDILKEILRDRLFLALSFFIIVLDFSYPLTITFDTGHYMFLADVIKDGAWAEWDPIRGIIFPLFLNLSTNILGRNQNALLIPMILAHLVLFLFSIYFILKESTTKTSLYKKAVIVLVFLLIILDPVVFGYYHTLLTEFFAATLAVVSIYVAVELFYFAESLPALSKPLILSFFYFLLAVPFAWHLKQPYIGTALFPFLLSCFLVVARGFRKKRVILYVVLANILIVISLTSSIFLWAGFLRVAGMPAKPDRELSGFFNREYETKSDVVLTTPKSFAKYVVKDYLALSNFFSIDKKNQTIVDDPSLTRAFQNRIIASRMYNLYGQSNIFYMTDELRSHVEYFSTNYYPPLWFNVMQVNRETISNLLFTSTYLIVPWIFIFSAIFFIRDKNLNILFIFIGSGSAFLNAVAHSVFTGPIDRYLFWGYPLNIIVISILLIKVITKICGHYNFWTQS